MGDMGEYWNDVKPQMKEESKRRRAFNRKSSAEILRERGVSFESKNKGAHLVVQGKDFLIDFWPGTGKYIAWNGRKGRGVRNLLKLCANKSPE